jgi:hypothetical protein
VREFRAGPTAFLAGCSAVWASKAPAPGRPPGVLFYFRVFQKIICVFKRKMYWHLICIYPVTFNYLFKLGKNHGYL